MALTIYQALQQGVAALEGSFKMRAILPRHFASTA